ncbi:MAG: hypothetical protein CME33_14075 [Gimesia sp.]|uniref:DUF6881 domain-containing protein n=1 Tax=Gimesia sp. TaxID=2024833 RepID=UPI000C43FDB1|nr:hypothetical protein [Gimesia sp.]
MEYLKVEWLHSNKLYPILLYSELDEDRMEIRKVEQYRDGKFCFADHERATGDTQLSIEPLPSIENIASDPQFLPTQITHQEFEDVWMRCSGSTELKSPPS